MVNDVVAFNTAGLAVIGVFVHADIFHRWYKKKTSADKFKFLESQGWEIFLLAVGFGLWAYGIYIHADAVVRNGDSSPEGFNRHDLRALGLVGVLLLYCTYSGSVLYHVIRPQLADTEGCKRVTHLVLMFFSIAGWICVGLSSLHNKSHTYSFVGAFAILDLFMCGIGRHLTRMDSKQDNMVHNKWTIGGRAAVALLEILGYVGLGLALGHNVDD